MLDRHCPGSNHEIRPRHKIMPMGSIAHSHIMAGDTRSCIELRGVFLVEVNSTLPEIPSYNTRGVRTNMNKFP